MSIASELRGRTWRRDSYLISTDASLIPVPQLNEIFASDGFYWGKPVPDEVMKEMLDSSLCFGLYHEVKAQEEGNGQEETNGLSDTKEATGTSVLQSSSTLAFLGIARCVTDFTTFLYVTDVWVNPERQGEGLGKWLMSCVQEVILSMPYLRRSLLFTADWERSVPFYQRLMDMNVCEFRQGEGIAMMERRGKGHPGYGLQGPGYTLKKKEED
ncbi:gcn5-related n-acetyltransferase [Mariannaea sp. PMI_226]|nr:gcn5-related n-acetyltransferase [Mariannaea sp. PMI_226]